MLRPWMYDDFAEARDALEHSLRARMTKVGRTCEFCHQTHDREWDQEARIHFHARNPETIAKLGLVPRRGAA